MLRLFSVFFSMPLFLGAASFTEAELQVLGFETNWSGLSFETNRTKEGKTGGLWKDQTRQVQIASDGIPHDLSAFGEMRLWAYSEISNNAEINVVFESKSDPKILSYYKLHFFVNWTGWKEIVIPFSDLAPVRSPVGFQKIDRLVFSAVWGGKALPDTVLYLDDLRFLPSSQKPKRPLVSTAFPRPERIAEIAALLSPRPIVPGRPLRDRKAWEKIAGEKSLLDVVSQAERKLKEAIPELTPELYNIYQTKGSRGEFERPYHERTWRLSLFTVAECVENGGRFLPAIEKECEAILSEDTWVIPASADFKDVEGVGVELGASARGWLLAMVDNWLAEKLSSSLRQSIRRECQRRVFAPILLRSRPGGPAPYWWMIGYNNWNAVCHSGVVGAALGLLESPLERAEFVALAEKNLSYFINGYEDDGFCGEGIAYWGYGFSQFFSLSEAIRLSSGGRLDLISGTNAEKISRMALFPWRLEILGGLYPAFGDASAYSKKGTWEAKLLARGFALPETPGTSLEIFASGDHPLGYQLWRTALVWFDRDFPKPTSGAQGKLPLRDAFPSGGAWIFRPEGLRSDQPAIAIKGGHNGESHNHNDNGSYTVVLGGSTPLLDPGTDAYTKETFGPHRYDSDLINSFGHPLPLVAGKKQKEGRSSRAEILEIFSSDKEERIVMDLRSGYEVPELKILKRTFHYFRGERGSRIEIEDEVEMNEPGSFESALITQSQWEEVAPGEFRFGFKTPLRVRVRAEGGECETVSYENWKTFGAKAGKRVALKFKKPVQKAKLIFSMEAADASKWGAPANLSRAIPSLSSPAGILAEAEAFSSERGGKVEVVSRVESSGAAFRNWEQDGHSLAWKIEVPRAGDYGLELRYCTALDTVERILVVDEKKIEEVFLFEGTGGWSLSENNWKNVFLHAKSVPLRLHLEKGSHVLEFRAKGISAMNLDWIKLVVLP